jgi:hypothetical protein
MRFIRRVCLFKVVEYSHPTMSVRVQERRGGRRWRILLNVRKRGLPLLDTSKLGVGIIAPSPLSRFLLWSGRFPKSLQSQREATSPEKLMALKLNRRVWRGIKD